jgi:L-alanine-DL-glutamate epimerase-like enolase superfamily enzyme
MPSLEFRLKIDRIEAIPIEVPVRRPLKMAVATVYVRTCIVVRVTTDDGVVGLGESVLARYFSGESLASASDLIANEYGPALVGQDPTNVESHRKLMRQISVGNSGARAAVEMALLDITAQAAGIPLYQYYGGRSRESVPTIWHVSGGTPDEMAAEAGEAVADGYPMVKVKVGRDVDDDLAATYAVRAAVGDDVVILPDANQGWSVGDALRYLTGVADARPGFVEQPVSRHDMMGMAHLVSRSPVLVAGDEGVFDEHDLRTYLAVNAVGAVVTKLMKAAGPIGVRNVIALADAAGIGVHFAGMAGQTSISAAHGAHLALAVPLLRFGSGISPQYLADDVCTERFLPQSGHLHPSDAPGVGVQIDEESLTKYRVDR